MTHSGHSMNRLFTGCSYPVEHNNCGQASQEERQALEASHLMLDPMGEIQLNEIERAGRALDDIKIHMRFKLSALWATVLFCAIYGDIFRLFQHGELQEMLDGMMWSTPVTQGLLVGTSIIIAIPSLMVFLSLVLKPNLNRWLNIICAVSYAALMIFTMTSPGAWAYYLFLGVVEVALTVLIVWYAWNWPKQGEA